MKLAPVAFAFLLASACQKPTEMQEPAAKQTTSMAEEQNDLESDGEWKLTQIVDRLTDEQGIEANGIVSGAKVSVRCMSANSLAYVFDLSDRTDDVGIFGRSAAVQIRLDDASPEETTVQTDRRFPNQVRIDTGNVARDLDSLAEHKAWDWEMGDGRLLAVRMAIADRIRLAVRTASGDTFIDFQQPDAIRSVLRQCSAAPDEYHARFEAKSTEAKQAVDFRDRSEELRSQLAACIKDSGLADSGTTTEVGFDVRADGPANFNPESMGSLIQQCWPSYIPDRLVGKRVMMRLPG